MAFTTYTRDELRDIIIAHIRGRVTGANVAQGSDYWHLATAIATVVHGDQAAAQYLVQQVLPSTSERRFLETHSYMRGLSRAQPTAAQGKVVAKASTTGTIALAADAELEHTSGLKYTVRAGGITATASWSSKKVAPGTTRGRIVVNPNASDMAVDDVFTLDGTVCVVKAVVPDTGTPVAIDLYVPLAAVPTSSTALTPKDAMVVTVDASDTGANTNLAPGETLTLSSAPTGLDEDTIVLEMSGGRDLETDAELAARVLAFMGERPGSGNRSDYRAWARETPNVGLADAFVYPAYRGVGTVDVVPFGVSNARVTGSIVNTAISDHLDDEASFSDDVRVKQLTEPTAVDLTLTITASPGYEADWSDSYTADTDTSTTSEIAIDEAPDAIEIGDRVLLQTDTISPRLWQRTVVGKLTSPDRIVLDEDLPESVTDGSTVLPGGPLAQPIIDAISALFDDLGPGDTDPATRYPTPGEAHSDLLALARIDAVVMGVKGVLNVDITAPASDQSPASLTRLKIGEFTLNL